MYVDIIFLVFLFWSMAIISAVFLMAAYDWWTDA